MHQHGHDEPHEHAGGGRGAHHHNSIIDEMCYEQDGDGAVYYPLIDGKLDPRAGRAQVKVKALFREAAKLLTIEVRAHGRECNCPVKAFLTRPEVQQALNE